jgi:DNA invertase Pin-like site-specific DNA recombinase
MQRFAAIYLRVSSRQEDTRSQEPYLKRWVGRKGKVAALEDEVLELCAPMWVA